MSQAWGSVHAVRRLASVRPRPDGHRRHGRTFVVVISSLLLATGAVAGCAGFTSDPALTLGLDSGLDRPVLLYVNDEWVGTFPVGSDRDDITTSAHGGPPWRVEARTDAGITLAVFEAADEAALPTGVAVLTACGDVEVWAGQPRPEPQEPDRAAAPVACD